MLKKVSSLLGKSLDVINSLYCRSKNLRRKYPSVQTVEEFIKRNQLGNHLDSKSLDLGCGKEPRNPFGSKLVLGIDIRDDLNKRIIQSDLFNNKIPLDDSSYDYCTAFDFIEHVPRAISQEGRTRFPFIELVEEVHRILKPGGIFLHLTPAYPSKEVFQDPTHINFITEDTFPNYFCRPNSMVVIEQRDVFPEAANYGFKGDFTLLDQAWIRNAWIICLMRAVK